MTNSTASVQYGPLGASGLMVSSVGLGTNSFGVKLDPDGAREVVDACFDAGITLFDTSDTYGGEPGDSERILGRALGSRREQVIVATKFGMDARGANGPDWGVRGSRRYIRAAVEHSLRRLGTDYIDLYQLHAPDPVTPIEETMAALHELVTDGKVRYVGSSNLAGWQIVDADWTARTAGYTPFISAQNKYSLLARDVEGEVIPAAERVGAGILPYFPLASGLLTGKYRRGQAAPEGTRLASRPERLEAANFDVIEGLEAFARQRGITLLDVAMGWLRSRPAVGSVIAGATSRAQVESNTSAAAWEPSDEDIAEIDGLTGA
ncbi:aldo/keto reductase [Spelaeicoccus albus]|uniref:Aryl-alcohol dehydrogenase-like predicted oxidoreductase n=1 Tax=Spelaeicoccus albus TaxID=1280376 RepID=A0A7Z0D3Z2_9MICO|nr:aldo/keto reductase [Spelaeicoccus albus]NYI68371.1 aryl-alcohol dehydrogenase-like predicted oxidoreductase [Spelaeicoccus albus]